MLSGLYIDTCQTVGESSIKLDKSAVGASCRREGAFRFLCTHNNGGLLMCQIQPPQNDANHSPLVLNIQELVSPDSTSIASVLRWTISASTNRRLNRLNPSRPAPEVSEL